MQANRTERSHGGLSEPTCIETTNVLENRHAGWGWEGTNGDVECNLRDGSIGERPCIVQHERSKGRTVTRKVVRAL